MAKNKAKIKTTTIKKRKDEHVDNSNTNSVSSNHNTLS